MGVEGKSYKRGRRKKSNYDANTNKRVSGNVTDESGKAKHPAKSETITAPRKTVIRYKESFENGDELH